MASQKDSDKLSSRNSDTVVLNVLFNMFGDVLDQDIIKSVALNCRWQLDTASNILAELSSCLTNDQSISKSSVKESTSSNINTVGYAAAGDDDNDVDVLIEGEKKDNTVNGVFYSRIVTQPAQKRPGNAAKRNRTPSGRSAPNSTALKPNQLAPKPNHATPKANQAPAKLHQSRSVVQNKSKKELEVDRVRKHILTGAKVLVLLRGLPGSGKSHLAEMLIAASISEDPRRFVYSTDDFFMINGTYNYNVVKLQDAHCWNQQRVFSAMHLGMSPVIVDNTHTQMWEMRPYARFAIQFGYAVEILEPPTVWIFNPPELARRNVHQVPKEKIADMLDRYEKNITPEKLFAMYGLQYTPQNHPPQPRLHPPFARSAPLPFHIPAVILRGAPPTQTAQAKKKRPRKKKADSNGPGGSTEAAANKTISKSESQSSLLTNDASSDSDFSEFVHEHPETNQPPVDLLSNSSTSQEYVLVLPDSSHLCQKTHEDQQKSHEDRRKSPEDDVNLINFDCHPPNRPSNPGDFSEELFPTSEQSQMQKKTAELIDSCIRLFKTVTTNEGGNQQQNGLLDEQNECLDNQQLLQQQQQGQEQQENSSVKVPVSGSYPKLDLSSWGLTDEALISWEMMDKSQVKPEAAKDSSPQPQRPNFTRQLTTDTKDSSTNTSSDDFTLLKSDSITIPSDIKILATSSRNIAEGLPPLPRTPPRISSFDKSTMTGCEHSLNAALNRNRCSQEAQHFSQLLHLFPSVGEEELKDIFEKCRGDINWAADLLLDASKDSVSALASGADGNMAEVVVAVIDAGEGAEVAPLSRREIHQHSLDCSCTGNYETPLYVSPPQDSPRDQSEAKTEPAEVRKSPARSKNRVTEETLLLKKQLEEQFKIDDTFYSEHVLNLRKKRHGELEPSEEEPQPSTSEIPFAQPSTSKEPTEAEMELEMELQEFSEERSEDSSEEEMIELNVGANFVEQLEKSFGETEVEYPKGFQPVMQLPASLVRQLHAYWLESVCQQMHAQSQILEAMVREDEEFARRLQEKEAAAAAEDQKPEVPDLQEIMDMEIVLAIYKADQEQWKKETPDDLASRMKRQKLFETFPNYDQNTLVEILHSYGNSFDQTVEVLLSSVEQGQVRVDETGGIRTANGTVALAKQNELIENAKKEYIQAKEQEDEKKNSLQRTKLDDECSRMSPEEAAAHYREEAAHHLKMRIQCYSKANESIQKGLTQVAAYYSEIAQMHLRKFEQANELAASSFLSAHSLKQQNTNFLDLHFLYVKEAEQALAMFLDEHISRLKNGRKVKDILFVITGRGNHSRGRVSHIKPAVKRRLKERKLVYVEMNPGLLKVIIKKHSIMTNDLNDDRI